MRAVSDNIYRLIKTLQALPGLNGSVLAGGTNLAIRYDHRISHDIDLFFPGSIGRAGFQAIKEQIENLRQIKLIAAEFPLDLDDIRTWLRCFVLESGETIKVDMIQNMTMLDEPDIDDSIRLATERDIGLMKLMTACNRAARKDIYDLDYITDRIPLSKLMADLQQKLLHTASSPKSVFEFDYNASPISHPELLLRFELTQQSTGRLWHANQQLLPIDGQKNWFAARSSWRSKVRSYFRTIDVDFPVMADLARIEQQLTEERSSENKEDDDIDFSHGYTR